MNIKDTRKEYTNGEVTIVWQVKKCMHAEYCWRGLPDVFRYKQRPWVDPEGASSEAIMKQIDQCPSGALTYYKNSDGPAKVKSTAPVIEVMENGPLLVRGSFLLKKQDGTEKEEQNAALCRCGVSSNKPYCDGSHKRIEFDGA